MGRGVIGMCALFGSVVGGYVPVLLWGASSLGVQSMLFGAVGAVGSLVGSYVPVVLWGASSLGVQSLLFGALGSVVGVFVGARYVDS